MNDHSMPYARRFETFLDSDTTDLGLIQVNANSSVLTSILYIIREQCTGFIGQEDQVMLGYESELGNSTEVSTSLSQDTMENFWFIEPVSNFNGKVIVGKPFSMILRISNLEQGEITLERPVGFDIILENCDTRDTQMLDHIESSSILYLKQILIKQYTKHARLVIKSENENILPYIQNIEMRKNKRNPSNEKIIILL